MARILLCDKIHSEAVKILERAGLKVDEKPDIKPEELREMIKDYDGVVVRGRTKITKEIIRNASKLKVIVRAGVGLDNVDVQAAEERGIKVANTAEAVTQSTAELAVGLMLSVARQIPTGDVSVKRGEWIKSRLTGRQLMGKTLGVIGFGRVGSKVARLAKALGMEVLAYDISPNEPLLKEVSVELTPLKKLLSESDIVTLHVPLTHETMRMIGKRELSLMKNGAVIINTARGPVVDEEALLEALKSGKLGGAGLDCYSVEPPQNLELLKLPNVVCTPHIGAETWEAQREAGIQAAQKVIDLLKS